MESPFDLFLAHASDDRDAFVVPLVKELRAGGVSVWYSQFESQFISEKRVAEDTLHRFLTEAMQNCSLGVLVISQRFLEKSWPKKELDYWLSSARSERRLTIVLLDVTIEDVSGYAHTSSKYLEEHFAIVSAELGARKIAQLITSQMGRRTILKMMDCQPPTDIVVFPDMGSVVIAQSGGLFGKTTGANMKFVDFSGRTITDRADKVLGALWGQLERGSILRNGNLIGFEGVPFQFKEKFKYAYLNHLLMQPFTPQEVQRGCFLNVGSNEAPYVITPFFTCQCYTGGVIDNKTTPFVDECLRVARGSWKGNWKRLIVNEDNESFQVIGEN